MHARAGPKAGGSLKRQSEVIRGHQRSSEVLRGHQRSSEVIRGHQRSSEVLRGPQRSSEVLRGHQRSSEVIRGHQRSSEVIRGLQRSSEVIRNQRSPVLKDDSLPTHTLPAIVVPSVVVGIERSATPASSVGAGARVRSKLPNLVEIGISGVEIRNSSSCRYESRAPCRAASWSTRVNMPSSLQLRSTRTCGEGRRRGEHLHAEQPCQLRSTRTAPEPPHNVLRRVPEARSSCRAQA